MKIAFCKHISNLLLIILSIITPARSGLPDNLFMLNNTFIFSTRDSQQSIWGLFFISDNVIDIKDDLSILFIWYWYFMQCLSAGINTGYLPSSPNTASLLHRLCTDNSRRHTFWFNSSGWKDSQNFKILVKLSNPFFGIIKGNQNSDAYRKIGLIRLSNSCRALYTANFLCWCKTLLIASQALLALVNNSSVANCIEPDGLNLMPRYW